MKINIVFANIFGGRRFLGMTYGSSGVGEDVLGEYINAIDDHNPDILALVEVHLEDSEHSTMVQEISSRLDMPFYYFVGTDQSHLVEGKIIGNAILSRCPIVDKKIFELKAPLIEIDRPNGDHWKLHNKALQVAVIDVADKKVSVANIHYFPFHLFERDMDDPEFSAVRMQFIESATEYTAGVTPIITGDFNNAHKSLADGYPELFQAGFSETIEPDTTVVGEKQHLDHILYRKTDAVIVDASTFPIPGDHFAIYAQLEI